MKKRSPLLIIFLVVFLDLVGFGIIIPILPFYAKEFGADALAWSWVMAAYSIAQFLFSPVWGAASDRLGRRPVLLISILGSAISLALMSQAQSVLGILLLRFLAGFFAANISTATAYITDATDESNRAKGMGIIGAGFGLGFLFGPAIGGLLSPYGLGVPIAFAAALSLLNFVLAYFILPEPIVSAEQRSQNRRRFGWTVVRSVFQLPSARLMTILFFLSTFAFVQLEVSFAFFVLERFGLDSRGSSFLFAWMGLVMVIVQGGLIGKLSKRFGEAPLARFGFLLMGISIGLSILPTTVWPFALLLGGVALANGLINPTLSSMMSKSAPAAERGAFMGIFHSASSLARVLGPPLAGFLYVASGSSSPLIAAALIQIVAFSLLIMGRSRINS